MRRYGKRTACPQGGADKEASAPAFFPPVDRAEDPGPFRMPEDAGINAERPREKAGGEVQKSVC